MLLKKAIGYELQKEKPNTSEDFFNRSIVSYVEDGVEKEFSVLYVRYFDEVFSEFLPYEQDPLFSVHERDVSFKDTVALVSLLAVPNNKNKKRIYINEKKELSSMYANVDLQLVKNIFTEIEEKGEYMLNGTVKLSV
ncbi:hypothetical protein [Alkalihalobacterium bogoriense]|uniref:hypothetical protein n=1 Tax=Alkalihalobacterium bogoriense TaxID=246272 RepID=UPI00047C5D7D|nr:hypothetical protein [Alkalihalobacterium bogoriense]